MRFAVMEMFRLLIGPDEGYQTMAQLSVRAVLLFAVGLALIRIAGRRTFTEAAPLDIIVYLIIGSNLSRVMAGKANVFPTLAATLTLVVLHRLLSYCTLHPSVVSELIKSHPTVLVRDGEIDRKAMLRAGLSDEDLLEGLRLKQLQAVSEVRLATLERGGKISVIPKTK